MVHNELRRMADAYGDEQAYACVGGGALTFAEWDGEASRTARGLVDAGMEPGDRIGMQISAPNALRFLVTYAAVHRAGCVAVPMNPRLAPAEVAAMITHSGMSALVADGPSLASAVQITGGDAAPLRLLVDASASPISPPPGSTVVAWDDLRSNDAAYFDVPCGDDDLADILYTSGTTGTPKGVAITHSGVSLIPSGGVPPWSGDTWLHASPMFTFAGIAFVYNPMKLGMRGLYQPRFDAGEWLSTVESVRPVAVFLVPSMVHLLLDHPAFESADLSSIRICAIGSAPLAPFALEKVQAKLPGAMVSSNYGMTEAGSVYAITPVGEGVKRPGTVGQIMPPAQVRIVGENGAEVLPGEIGDVHLKVPGRPREYYRDSDATAQTWRDGWLITGDIGKVDTDGYLYIVGRTKDVIIRGGNNIHAVDVEHVILRHDDIGEAAVVGAPHPVLGEDPVAFVVLRDGATFDPEGLRSFCLDNLADYKVPRRWFALDALPRNATGKVVKPELRTLLDSTSTAESGSADLRSPPGSPQAGNRRVPSARGGS